MAVTRLKRRIKKNYINRERKNKRCKKLLWKPVVKKVTIEEIMKSFEN